MLKNNKTHFLLFFALLMVSGCIHQKNLVYMQNQDENENQYSSKRKETYKIQPFDILTISVNSLDPMTSKIFENPSPFGGVGGGIQATNIYALAYFNGYTVNDSGYIQMPYIGKILVKDLSVSQISDTLSERLKSYLKFYSLNIKLANFRVTFLGEVAHPGVQYVYNQDITIFQAIGNAGDLTVQADRKKVRLIRQVDNQVKTVYVDLTDPNIINSEYYFLKPNDLIYVQPLKFKSQIMNFGTISLVLSSLSILVLVATLLIRR